MKNTLIITVLLLCSSFMIKAQDTLKMKHNPQPDSLIHIVPTQYGRHVSNLYTIGGRIVTSEEVLVRLQSYQPSSVEIQKMRNNFTWTWVTFGSGMATSVWGGVLLFKNSKYYGETTDFNPTTGQPEFVYQHHNKTAGYVVTGISLGLFTAGVIELVHAARHGKNAVHVYNLQYE